jgi:SAM-dependent methyltransferase
MAENFYDKLAEQFGGYATTARHDAVFPQVDPEDLFEHKLLEHGGLGLRALDVGCADGRNTLALAPHFREIVAIDTSQGMLAVARTHQQDMGIHHIRFLEQDVHHLAFSDASFDVVYSRRGPVDFAGFARVLSLGGWYVEITIGEKDAQALKEVFGRGQMFGRWLGESVRDSHAHALATAGVTVVSAEEFCYDEYYPSTQELDLFLQAVPIFEDYDSIKDRPCLVTYSEQNSADKGIWVGRHRVVIVARKQ